MACGLFLWDGLRWHYHVRRIWVLVFQQSLNNLFHHLRKWRSFRYACWGYDTDGRVLRVKSNFWYVYLGPCSFLNGELIMLDFYSRCRRGHRWIIKFSSFWTPWVGVADYCFFRSNTLLAGPRGGWSVGRPDYGVSADSVSFLLLSIKTCWY